MRSCQSPTWIWLVRYLTFAFTFYKLSQAAKGCKCSMLHEAPCERVNVSLLSGSALPALTPVWAWRSGSNFHDGHGTSCGVSNVVTIRWCRRHGTQNCDKMLTSKHGSGHTTLRHTSRGTKARSIQNTTSACITAMLQPCSLHYSHVTAM